jgi:alpha,alpha-trehalose-phosphate synthase [UDP-forming]
MLVALGFSYYEVRSDKLRLRKDLERRAEVLGDSLAGNVEAHWEKESRRELQRIVERFGNREHLTGVGVYDKNGSVLAITPGLLHLLPTSPTEITGAISEDHGVGVFTRLQNAPVQIYALPIHSHNEVVGALAIVHDASYISQQSVRVWRETFLRSLIQVLLITTLTLLIVRWSFVGPIAKAAVWMRALRTGREPGDAQAPELDLLSPLAAEVKTFARSLVAARSAAEIEAQLRETLESTWTAERLAVHVRNKLGKSRLVVVSNREPYAHVRKGRSVEVIVPPSGLVTALEPVLRACDGTWVAHGSGDADHQPVDKHSRLRVPPDDPRYTLRRVWLNKEEEQGYYFGFANEGLWPLCHLAHTRPVFRSTDWEFYQAVNRRFAEAALEEIKDLEQPLLLAQDYHFALLPKFVKERRPDARVAIFWHIPWPNAETFSICPYQRQLVEGLLGADLVGFHIQSHCNNFLETVDRTIQARVDWEHFSVTRNDHQTAVKPFPISVDFAEHAPPPQSESGYTDRINLLKELGISATLVGIGVDRVDYTKGIVERFLAVERLLEKHSGYRGKFTFIQIGAPSRTHIQRYHDFLAEVEREAERINWRFQTELWKPIVLLNRHHSHREIQRFYQAADVCVVTSLHDGMNLVAKEFLAARADEQGALVLSRFTGAARELHDAIIVNPYDTDQTAEAIHMALEMPAEERRERMRRMRSTVREHNVYRWAGNLVSELSDVRLVREDYSEVPERLTEPMILEQS